jgi:hypothetical protein
MYTMQRRACIKGQILTLSAATNGTMRDCAQWLLKTKKLPRNSTVVTTNGLS